jgi:cytochrome c oxidase subunit 2
MPAERGGGVFAPEGPVAGEIASLGWLLTILGTLTFILFGVALGVALVRRRRDGSDGPSPAALRRLVVWGGAVIPAIVLAFVLVATVDAMDDIPDRARTDALQVEVVGNQWWWEVRYPDHGVTTANEIHLPADRDVEVHLTSADVIHSFWVPRLAGKLDVLPDSTNTLLLRASEPGVHRTQCAEFCGLQHAKMGLYVVVEPEDAFSRWLEANARPAAAPDGDDARRGRSLFGRRGCGECHRVQGTDFDGDVGPDLTHLAGRRSIAAATLAMTRANLRDWIRDPHAIKSGVDMPALDLGEEELEAIVSYLEGLE